MKCHLYLSAVRGTQGHVMEFRFDPWVSQKLCNMSYVVNAIKAIYTEYMTGKSAIKMVYCTSGLYCTRRRRVQYIPTSVMARCQACVQCIARSVTSDIWRECNTIFIVL